MGIITWQNIPIPQVDSTAGLRTASDLFQRAAMAAKDSVAQVQESQRNIADRELLARAASIQDAPTFDAAMADGSLLDPGLTQNASPEVIKSVGDRLGSLIKQNDERYRSERAQKINGQLDAVSGVYAAAVDDAVNNRSTGTGLLAADEQFRNLAPEAQIPLYKNLFDATLQRNLRGSKGDHATSYKEKKDSEQAQIDHHIFAMEEMAGDPDGQDAYFTTGVPEHLRMRVRDGFAKKNPDSPTTVFSGAKRTLGMNTNIPRNLDGNLRGYDNFKGLHHDDTDVVAQQQGYEMLGANPTQEEAMAQAAKTLPVSVNLGYGKRLNSKTNKEEIVGSTATGVLQITNGTREQFGEAALGKNWKKSGLGFDNDRHFVRAIIEKEGLEKGLSRWEGPKRYAGFKDSSAFQGLDPLTQIAPVIAYTESNVLPDDHKATVELAESELKKQENALPDAAKIRRQVEEAGTQGKSAPELAAEMAKLFGAKNPNAVAEISQRITKIQTDANKLRGPDGRQVITMSAADAAGLLARAIQSDGLFTIEDVGDDNKLDVIDDAIKNWIATYPAAMGALEAFKSSKELTENQRKLHEAIVVQETEALRLLRNARTHSEAGRPAALAVGELYRLSEAMRGQIDVDRAKQEKLQRTIDEGVQTKLAEIRAAEEATRQREGGVPRVPVLTRATELFGNLLSGGSDK